MRITDSVTAMAQHLVMNAQQVSITPSTVDVGFGYTREERLTSYALGGIVFSVLWIWERERGAFVAFEIQANGAAWRVA